MCKYCGKEHEMIGDVVCPFKKQFGESYKTKYIKDFHSDTWPHYFEIDLNKKEKKKPEEPIKNKKTSFQLYMERQAKLGGGAGQDNNRD